MAPLHASRREGPRKEEEEGSKSVGKGEEGEGGGEKKDNGSGRL